MGTDITFCVERKVDGIWTFVPGSDRWYSARSYSFATALCGASSVRLIDSAFPPDVSSEVRELCGGDVRATESGCTTRYLTTLLAYDWPVVRGVDPQRLLAKMAALGRPEDVRAIFWFLRVGEHGH